MTGFRYDDVQQLTGRQNLWWVIEYYRKEGAGHLTYTRKQLESLAYPNDADIVSFCAQFKKLFLFEGPELTKCDLRDILYEKLK